MQISGLVLIFGVSKEGEKYKLTLDSTE